MSAIVSLNLEQWPQQYLKSLYVERKGGKLIAVATNVKIAAIELVSNDCAGPDEHCFIAFDPVLIEQARKEAQFSSSIEFVVMRELGMTIAKTLYGYTHAGSVGVFPTDAKLETPLWRNWLPDELPKESYGHMQMQCEWLAMLANASPSKEIVFPTFIDTRAPCIVRDQTASNWIGLFFPMFGQDKKPPKLRIPTW